MLDAQGAKLQRSRRSV